MRPRQQALVSDTKRIILFMSENVTLAQVVRLVVLARGLARTAHEVHFACSEFPELVFGQTRFVRHELETLDPELAARALRSGRRLYEKATLLRYIKAETELIQALRPDLVVADFRLSASTSAELCGVPCAVLINAYWSPFAPRQRFPVPDHPIIAWLGEALTEQYFPQALPRVFQHFAAPVNAARKQHGLGPVGSLLEVLCHGDYTLYPDDPGLTPVAGAPASHRFLGPVLWQPDVPDVAFPHAEAEERPLVYVTLGSSGDAQVLPLVIEALAGLPVWAVVATANRAALSRLPPNVVALPFVPGADLARRARVVVSNGGSTTGYQALSQGTPVLGLPSNLDQYLATEAIVRAGAGSCIQARRATAETLRRELFRMLADGELRAGARRVQERFRRYDAARAFGELVTEATGG